MEGRAVVLTLVVSYTILKAVGPKVFSHHVSPGLQVLEVLFLHSRHHPVVLQVLSHLHVVWVGLEEGVCGCHSLVQLVDLKRDTGVQVLLSR